MRIVSPAFTLGAVLLAGLSGSALLAQDQSQPAGTSAAAAPSATAPIRHQANPQRQAKRLAKRLGLTSDQEAKLEPILATRAQQVQAVHADSTIAPQDLRTRLKSIREDSNAKVEALLNDTQKQQFEQMKANRKAKRQQQSTTANS